MKGVYMFMIFDSLYILLLPVVCIILSYVFKIVKEAAQGCHTRDIAKELMKRNDELIKEEHAKTKNIDKDMEKYFNYKE